MKKNVILWLSIFLIVVVAGMVYADNDKEVVTIQTTSEPTAKNVTYGQCVSENVVIKNSCYATVKNTLDACKTQAKLESVKKDVTKQCKQSYKKEISLCKNVFKDSKKECKKIKHNFFETLGSSLK